MGGWAVLPSNICAFSRTNAANHSFRSELARAMALPTQALGTCFRRYSCPERENIGKIAKFLNISLAELTAQLEDVESVLELEKAKAADIIPSRRSIARSRKDCSD